MAGHCSTLRADWESKDTAARSAIQTRDADAQAAAAAVQKADASNQAANTALDAADAAYTAWRECERNPSNPSPGPIG